jgi:hypothetical protein
MGLRLTARDENPHPRRPREKLVLNLSKGGGPQMSVLKMSGRDAPAMMLPWGRAEPSGLCAELPEGTTAFFSRNFQNVGAWPPPREQHSQEQFISHSV